jgi:hypothetical protein
VGGKDKTNTSRMTHLFVISLNFGLVTNLLSDPVNILIISDTFQIKPAESKIQSSGLFKEY